MASNFCSGLINATILQIRFTSAMHISSLALDEFWVDTTLKTPHPRSSYILPPPDSNLGSDTVMFSFFSLELHSCLNILYTLNFTMKGFGTFQGSASLSSLGLN